MGINRTLGPPNGTCAASQAAATAVSQKLALAIPRNVGVRRCMSSSAVSETSFDHRKLWTRHVREDLLGLRDRQNRLFSSYVHSTAIHPLLGGFEPREQPAYASNANASTHKRPKLSTTAFRRRYAHLAPFAGLSIMHGSVERSHGARQLASLPVASASS